MLKSRAESEFTSTARGSWQPLFFRLNLTNDFEKLQELLKRHPEIQIFDTIDMQLTDLLKTQRPQQPLSSQELESMRKARFGNLDSDFLGVWVYYPWSARLVHLLDKSDFIQLRTDRNKYKITDSEQKELATKRIGVIGLSVGQSVAVTMALERIAGELRLADYDVLDLSNLNRIRSGVHNIGVPKVHVTAR